MPHRFIIFILFLLIFPGLVGAATPDPCNNVKAAARAAALEEYDRATSIYDEALPDPNEYKDASKSCISGLVDAIPSISVSTGIGAIGIPSLEDLLEMACKEIKSKLKINDFKYHYEIEVPDETKWTVNDSSQGDFEAIWNEIWREFD